MNMQYDWIVVLAGGDGDRFAPLAHKLCYSYCGKSLLAHVIERVSSYGKKTVVVYSVADEQRIRSALSGIPGILFVEQQKGSEGMGGAVYSLRSVIAGKTLILNGNDLFDDTLIPALLSRHETEGAEYVIAAQRVSEYFPGGYVVFEGDRVTGITEKPGAGNEPSSFVRLTADSIIQVEQFMSALEKTHTMNDDWYEQAMTALIASGVETRCVEYKGPWRTVKYPWHVLEVSAHLLSRITKKTGQNTRIHPTAIIEGDVVIGDGVSIGAFTKIAGPCSIDDGVVVGDHTLIRESMIGKGCVIGGGCEIARSYIGEGSMLHRNYVGDSVLEEGVLMGAGAVTANYRFDKEHIRTPVKGVMTDTKRAKFGAIIGANGKIGVNVTLYPGVKLASDAVVLPGEVVSKDRT